MKKSLWAKPLAYGFAASLLMAIVYVTVLSTLNSPAHAWITFAEQWFFMLPLIVLFGVQIALFVYIRNAHKNGLCHSASVAANAGASTAASGTVSTASMVACCVHHITDIVPFVGFSAAAIFLGKFQSFFLLLGIASGIGGTLMMLNAIKKNSLYSAEQKFLSAVVSPDLGLLLKAFIFFAVLVLVTAFMLSL